jgi:hypothetical protein
MELVFSSSDKKRVLYVAKDPKSVLHLMFSREKLVESVMPELSALYSQETSLKTYSGEQAVDILERRVKEEREVFSLFDCEEVDGVFLDKHKELIKNSSPVTFKTVVLKNSAGVEYASKIAKSNNETKFVLESGVGSFVVLSSALILFPRGKYTQMVLLENSGVVKTQKMLFNLLWKEAKTEGRIDGFEFPRENNN